MDIQTITTAYMYHSVPLLLQISRWIDNNFGSTFFLKMTLNYCVIYEEE